MSQTATDAERDAKLDKQSEKCRVQLIKEEDQRDWLSRKFSPSATLESADMLTHTPLYFGNGNHAGKLVTCMCEGGLRVDEPERLVHILEDGVGPTKGFGCGLLLVRRLATDIG